MYQLRRPFESELDNLVYLLSLSAAQVDTLLQRILRHCDQLEEQMKHSNIVLRANRMFIHCVDVDYIFPDNYRFVEECRKFVASSGFIVFDHLYHFELVQKFLEMFKQALAKAQHPLTGDTLWHLNPFTIDMMQAEIFNIYNFRGETPNERRLLAELLNFPPVAQFPLDCHNTWDMESLVFVDSECDSAREPLALCRFIRKNDAPTGS